MTIGQYLRFTTVSVTENIILEFSFVGSKLFKQKVPWARVSRKRWTIWYYACRWALGHNSQVTGSEWQKPEADHFYDLLLLSSKMFSSNLYFLYYLMFVWEQYVATSRRIIIVAIFSPWRRQSSWEHWSWSFLWLNSISNLRWINSVLGENYKKNNISFIWDLEIESNINNEG